MRSIGEIIAVYIDDKPSFYARIEDYEADVKPRWFKVKMLFLTFPLQEVTWILREAQVDGEPFTMNNIPVKLNTIKSSARSDNKIIILAERARVSKDKK
jgi:hypothetical protein